MEAKMNEERKFPIGMVLKILFVLALPLVLFNYMDSQPAVVETSGVSSAPENLTKNVAVVNEDLGYSMDEETITLGQEIPAVLTEQFGEGKHSWTVVNRSTANRGLDDQTYDAILYIPSNFTENILTFREETPIEATVNYTVQPKLTAKDQENMHRMIAYASSAINEEISTIYWSYVTKEVGKMKEQFDAILQKEIEFQEAMYSFYAPSSDTLANEISRQRDSLESILQQTNQVDEVSSDSANAAAEAESQVTVFAEALEAYKQSNIEQQQLLTEFQTANMETVQTSTASAQQIIQLYQDQINGQFDDYQPPVFAPIGNLEAFNNHFTNVDGKLTEGFNIFNQWQSDSTRNEMNREFMDVNLAVLGVYNQGLYNQANQNMLDTINEIRGLPKEDVTPSLPEPPEELDEMNEEELNQEILDLETEIARLKEIVKNLGNSDDNDSDKNDQGDDTDNGDQLESPDKDKGDDTDGDAEEDSAIPPTTDGDPTNDQDADDSPVTVPSEDTTDPTNGGTQDATDPNIDFSTLDTTVQQLKVAVSSLENDDANSKQFENYADKYKTAYDELNRNFQNVHNNLRKYITAKQEDILSLLSKEERKQYTSKFLSASELADINPGSLYGYIEDLTYFEHVVVERDAITPFRVGTILDDPKVKQEITDLLAVDSQYADQFSSMFESLMGDSEEIGELAEVEQSFNQLVMYVESYLNEYKTFVQEENEKILSNLDTLIAGTSEIAEQLQTNSTETYEWQESPATELLDGQMVVSVQQGAATNLEQLSSMVSSLGESQSSISSATDELQGRVNTVQNEADSLNSRWSTNVDTTVMFRDDVYEILENAVVDGQENPTVYGYLASPVNVQSQVNGQVLAETEEQIPPVMMFIIILICGLLIGFISHYYATVSYFAQGALFVLMNLAAGLIISIYGLNAYGLDNGQAILWSTFTILLLIACSNVVRGGLFVGPFVGWLVSIGVTIFFISPLLNIVIPEFRFDNQITNVYMSLQYGIEAPVTLTMIILAAIILVVSVIIYGLQVMHQKNKVDLNEEKAS